MSTATAAGSDVSALAGPLLSGSWTPGGAAAFHVSFSAPGGTVAHLVSWALEYVSPLKDWLDALVGDEGQVESFASTWRGVATDLSGLQTDLAATARSVEGLEGHTARALRKRLDDLGATLGDASEWTEATAASLELASTIVTAVHDAVVGALSELAGLVADLFGFSLNPFDKVGQLRELSSRAQSFIRIVGDLVEKMIEAFHRLVALFQALEPLIQNALLELRALLGKLIQELSPILGFAGGAVAGMPFGPLGILGGSLVGGLLAGVLGGGASDVLALDPRVTELDPSQMTDEERQAWENAQGVTSLDSVSSLVAQNGFTDAMGKTDRSVVDIKEVVGADGTTHYVVSLPSTQDWNLLKGPMQGDWAGTFTDDPATNDLDSNVALMVMNNPAMRTQYERAVLQAMSDAGVPAGADVVYTGFSQGGIMAASLASHPTPYNTVGIVTNGSPIDGFDIPPQVRVVSFEHDGDVVPKLDLTSRPEGDSGNRTTAHLPAPANGPAHNNDNYVHSVQAWEAAHPQEAADLTSLLGGTVVDHQMHTWSE